MRGCLAPNPILPPWPCTRPPNHRGPHQGDWGSSWNDPTPADHDQVKAPEHYRFPNGAEVKDITQWLTFFRGSAIKYICRAGRKAGVDELTDLRKARECIDSEIRRLEVQRAAQ